MEKQPAVVKLIECSRDAMQGWQNFIPTEKKVAYLNLLLKAGFDTIDFGSFVSPKAIPQMADTKEVISKIDYSEHNTKLLAIVANIRGAQEAIQYDAIAYLGYPFSISETFQLRNTNHTITDSLESVRQIQNICSENNKQPVIYISMGFGNPYGDLYNKEIVLKWVAKMVEMDIKIISLADTVGVADPDNISYLFDHLIAAFPAVEFGAHFHSSAQSWEEKIAAAHDHGCRRFDSAINGIGGCPMAKDELVGNIATEDILYFLKKRNISTTIDLEIFKQARLMAAEVFI